MRKYLLLLTILLPIVASAYDAKIDGIYYRLSGNEYYLHSICECLLICSPGIPHILFLDLTIENHNLRISIYLDQSLYHLLQQLLVGLQLEKQLVYALQSLEFCGMLTVRFP